MANDLIISPVRTILEGGPPEILDEFRVCHSPIEDRKVKIPHPGGYEHFELVDDYPDTSEPSKGPDLLAEFTASLDRIEGYMYRPDPSTLMLKNQLRYELERLRQLVYAMSIA